MYIYGISVKDILSITVYAYFKRNKSSSANNKILVLFTSNSNEVDLYIVWFLLTKNVSKLFFTENRLKATISVLFTRSQRA